MKKEPKIEFDYLQMYFGEPYVIDLENAAGTVTVYQPTIGDIVRIGEKRFYDTLNVFVTNTTSCRLFLWEKMGIDWNDISNFELFITFFTLEQIDPEVSKLMFGDLNFYDFQIIGSSLYNPNTDTEINSDVYMHISQYLRNVFNIFPEDKLTKDPILKQWYINADKRARHNAEEMEKQNKKKVTSIQSIISSCINHPGFKYKLHELKEVGICEFYDSVNRLQIYENTTALLKGMYSGFIDTKKMNKDACNFMQDFRR